MSRALSTPRWDYSQGGQLVADAVGAGEVLVLAGLAALVQQGLDAGGVDALAPGLAAPQGLQERGRPGAEHAQHPGVPGEIVADAPQQLPAALALAQPLVLQDATGQADHAEHPAHGRGGVQVVVHVALVGLLQLGQLSGQLGRGLPRDGLGLGQGLVDRSTLAAFVTLKGLNPEAVVLEHNGTIAARDAWEGSDC